MGLRDRKHAASAARGVAQSLNDPWLGEEVLVLSPQEIHHELDHLTRREMVAGRLVGEFVELSNQLLVEVTHFQV